MAAAALWVIVAVCALSCGLAAAAAAVVGVGAAPGPGSDPGPAPTPVPDPAVANWTAAAASLNPRGPGPRPAPTDAGTGVDVGEGAAGPADPSCAKEEEAIFPGMPFDQDQLRRGAVVLYFVFAFYGFCIIALVCEGYFLPTVEILCEDLRLAPDIAAATFMSMASSAPELFVNVVTTFLTKSSMGVGTTVGSATFNVLGLAALVGLASRAPISIRSGPVLRDSLFYVFAIAVTTCVVWDGRVEWWEALAMVLCSVAHLTFMFTHLRLARWARTLLARTDSTIVLTTASKASQAVGAEAVPDPGQGVGVVLVVAQLPGAKGDKIGVAVAAGAAEAAEAAPGPLGPAARCRRAAARACAFVSWPVSFALSLTIVDCKQPRLRSLYPLTFILCVVWIALAAYVVSWMLAVIGSTFQIPDAVMGIVLLSAGGSTPEAISAVIMSRKGVGSVGISNGLGANTLNMMMNLGIPWLVRALVFPELPWNVLSPGLHFDLVCLVLAVVVLNVVLAVSRYRLGTAQGVCTFVIYVLFVVMLVLFELNVFGLLSEPAGCSTL